MIAALPMYDFPHLRAATDALWSAIRDALRARGIEAPHSLTRGGDLGEQWRDKTLLLGQTCGYPYWISLRPHAEILATPIYAFAGCEGPNHRSFILAHADDARTELKQFRGDRVAVNSFDSNSGMNLLRACVAPLARGEPFFADVVVTGGHALSVVAIVERRADIAAIDCVSYALLARGASRLIAATKIIGETPATPALPFITSRAQPTAIRVALREALRDLPPQPELGLTAVAFLPETAYARIEQIEREAIEAGYPRLA